jgi:hypothetical protein
MVMMTAMAMTQLMAVDASTVSRNFDHDLSSGIRGGGDAPYISHGAFISPGLVQYSPIPQPASISVHIPLRADYQMKIILLNSLYLLLFPQSISSNTVPANCNTKSIH